MACTFQNRFRMMGMERGDTVILQQNLSAAINAVQAQRQQSVSALSKELRITKSSLQDILEGTGNPQIGTVERMANQLHVDPLTLLFCTHQTDPAQRGLLLLQHIREISSLPQTQQNQLAELFCQIIALLEPAV